MGHKWALFWARLGWKSLAEFLTRALSLVYFVLLARILGESAYGLYALPLGWAALFAVVIDWGGNTLILREQVRAPEQESQLWSALIHIKIVASALFFLLLLILLLFQPAQLSFPALLAAGIIVLSQGWMDTLVAILNAQGHYYLELRLRLLARILTLTPQLLVLYLWPDLLILLWTAAGTGIVTTALVYYLAGKLSLPKRPDWLFVKLFFQQGLGFWLANVSWMLYLKIDLVMLSLWARPEQELGWYQAAIRFYDLALLIAYLFSSVLLPLLSCRDQKQLSPERLAYYLSSVGIIGAGLAGAGIVLSNHVFLLILGQNYLASSAVLSVLLLGIPYVFMSLLWFTILGAQNLQHLVARAAAVCLLFNICLNSFLIPASGFTGAAWATVASDFALWLILAGIAWQKKLVLLKHLLYWSWCWLPLALLAWLALQRERPMLSALGFTLIVSLSGLMILKKRQEFNHLHLE